MGSASDDLIIRSPSWYKEQGDLSPNNDQASLIPQGLQREPGEGRECVKTVCIMTQCTQTPSTIALPHPTSAYPTLTLSWH